MLFDLMKYAGNVAFHLDDGRKISYGELARNVSAFQERMTLGKGLFLIEADNSLNTMVAYLAALAANCPVLLVEPSESPKIEGLKNRFSILYHYVAPSDGLSTAVKNPGTDINTSLALMLSTSGSTGTPKFVCLSFDNLRSNALSIAEYLDLSEDDCAPTNLPFFYSYGISVVNSHLMVGASLWLTHQSVMDESFWPRFDQLECTSFAGVPHTYEMLDKMDFSTADRKTLRYCSQAGGKLSKALIMKNAQAAKREGWQFFVMYGQTEASPRISYLPPEHALQYPECIGVPIPGGELALVDENGKRIDEPNVEGELVYTGPNVMMGYALGNRDLNQSPGEPLLKTGDIACRNRDGLFYIVGRHSRFLKLFGLRISLDTVESFLAQHEVKAVCGGTDQHLGILVAGACDPKEIQTLVTKWLGIPQFSAQVFSVEEVPLHSNGKIDYPRVSSLLLEKVGDAEREVFARCEHDSAEGGGILSLSVNEALLASIYSEAVGLEITDASLSLRRAGADSLSIVHVLLELEKHVPEIPEDWMDRPIRDLARLVSGERRTFLQRMFSFQSVEAFVVFRALAIFCVVAHHFNWFVVPGGTTTLLFIIGGYLYVETNRETIFGQGDCSRLWNGLIILLSTLVPISVIMAAAHTLTGNDWHATLLLPYENLSVYVNDLFNIQDTQHHVHWLWFIHAYIQVFFFIALALSLRSVRHFLSHKPFEKMLSIFFVFEALAVAVIFFDSGRQDLGHSAGVLQYAPSTILPLVLYGALIALIDSPRQWLWACAAGLTYILLYGAGVFTQGGIATLLVVTVLLYTKTIKLPGFLFLPAMLLSEASLFVYLTHKPIEFAIENLLHLSLSPPILVIVSLLLSLALWPVWRSFSVNRIRKLISRWGHQKTLNRTTTGVH